MLKASANISEANIWQVAPTTADLIAATNKLTVHVSGLPLGIEPYKVAERMQQIRLPLEALPAGKSLTEGEDLKEIRLTDGQVLCTAQTDSFGRTDLRFTSVLADLVCNK